MSLKDNKSSKKAEASIKIPFDSTEHAEIAYRVLSVDQEPKRNFVSKNLRLTGDSIEVNFTADQLRQKMAEHSPAPTPHRAIYGYAFYLLVMTLFIFYFLWALLPTKEWGLTYLPDKYFAIMLPMLVLVGLSFFAFFIYPAINMSLTAKIDEMASIIDARLLLKRNTVQSWHEIQQEMIPVEKSCQNHGKFIENCIYCSGNHRLPKASEQIDTLRFMDLADINEQLFK